MLWGQILLNIIAKDILDLRGTIIPIALLELTRAFRSLRPSEAIEVLVSDQETKDNVFRVLRGFSYELINLDSEDTFYRITFKKSDEN